MGVKSKEDAHAMGYTSAFYGGSKDNNPYPSFTSEWKWWNAGWDELTAEEAGQNKASGDGQTGQTRK